MRFADEGVGRAAGEGRGPPGAVPGLFAPQRRQLLRGVAQGCCDDVPMLQRGRTFGMVPRDSGP
jgi:hypothetical protein